MRTLLTWSLAAMLVVSLTTAPALASDSYSWGVYGAPSNVDYGRARLSTIPAGLASAGLITKNPWVVPDPNPADQSQSTPVVVGNRIFFFAYHGTTQAALYESDFSSGQPGQAREIISFDASNNEQYNSPGDPSVSPDGKWLAYAGGYHIYWWQIGDWCPAGSSPSCPSGMGRIPHPPSNPVAYVSSAPLFVPDPSPGSGGWDVCSGSGNGGFTCLQVGSRIPTIRPYTTSGSPITSSAVEVSPSRACFGIASNQHPRVVCLDPHGSAVQDGMGLGHIHSPVDTALTYANGSLYFTDQYGAAYRMDPDSGAVQAVQPDTAGGGLDIAPVAVDGEDGLAYVVARSYTEVCALDASTLGYYWGTNGNSCYGSTVIHFFSGDMTAATAMPVSDKLCQGDLVWDATNGGAIGAVDVCSNRSQPTEAFDAPTSAGGGHNFSALVVGVGPGGSYAVLWSDTAVTCWVPGGACADQNGPPAGFAGAHGSMGGGLEVWHLQPPLTAWFETNPAYAVPPNGGAPSEGECLLALSRPDEFPGGVTAVLPDGSKVALKTVDTGQITDTTGTGSGSGIMFNDSGISGCPNAGNGAAGSYFGDAAWGFGSQQYPHATDGTDPTRYRAYQLWEAIVPWVPGTVGAWKATVSGTAADGTPLTVRPALYTKCPLGTSQMGNNTCFAPPPPPPQFQCPAGYAYIDGACQKLPPLTPQGCPPWCAYPYLVPGPTIQSNE